MSTNKSGKLTYNQLQWALGHDWCIRVDTYRCLVIARDTYSGQKVRFTNFKKLYKWAGY